MEVFRSRCNKSKKIVQGGRERENSFTTEIYVFWGRRPEKRCYPRNGISPGV
jgi:hypothetical protein